MKQLNIIVADSDESFAAKVQERIENQLGDAVDVTIITSLKFLADFFSVPRSVDALLIDKGMYFSDIERHSINTICILTDNPDECTSGRDGSVDYVYRFASLKDICAKLLSGADDAGDFKSGGTRVLLVTSPVGGCGKTTVSLAVSQILGKSGKKVLYIDTSNIQTSSFWVKYPKKSKSDFDIADNLSEESISETIVRGDFDYVLPLVGTLGYVGATGVDYAAIVSKVKSSDKYDWIIIDTPADFSESTASLINIADIVFVMIMQDRFSISKVNKFLNTVDCSDSDKFKFICSHYKDNVKSYFGELVNEVGKPGLVPYANMSESEGISELSQLNCFKCISALLG